MARLGVEQCDVRRASGRRRSGGHNHGLDVPVGEQFSPPGARRHTPASCTRPPTPCAARLQVSPSGAEARSPRGTARRPRLSAVTPDGQPSRAADATTWRRRARLRTADARDRLPVLVRSKSFMAKAGCASVSRAPGRRSAWPPSVIYCPSRKIENEAALALAHAADGAAAENCAGTTACRCRRAAPGTLARRRRLLRHRGR